MRHEFRKEKAALRRMKDHTLWPSVGVVPARTIPTGGVVVQVLGDELAVGDRRHGQARHEAVELAGTVQYLVAGAGRKSAGERDRDRHRDAGPERYGIIREGNCRPK